MGVVVRLDAAAAAGPSGPETHALVDALRAVPEVARLLAGGETVEYSAHLVPELSFADAPPRSRPGLLVAGDAAGFVANYGFTVRGMDFAAASGILAGRAVVEAAKSGRPAEDAPGAYERALAGSFVLRDLAAARGLDRFLANDRFYGHYPRSVCALLEELFRVGAPGRGAAFRSTWKLARGTIANWRGFRDLWPARKL
jgi:electron transfer flavoprotein-quinone oxidoreductase